MFDVGETLIDETASGRAGRIGWARRDFTFMGALGAMIERNESFFRIFEEFRPRIRSRSRKGEAS